MRIHVQSGAVGEGVVAPVDAGVEAAAGKAASAAGSPGKLKLFLATKAGKITSGVAAFVVVAAIALGVGLGLGACLHRLRRYSAAPLHSPRRCAGCDRCPPSVALMCRRLHKHPRAAESLHSQVWPAAAS
jgi:hypothetical protein